MFENRVLLARCLIFVGLHPFEGKVTMSCGLSSNSRNTHAEIEIHKLENVLLRISLIFIINLQFRYIYVICRLGGPYGEKL